MNDYGIINDAGRVLFRSHRSACFRLAAFFGGAVFRLVCNEWHLVDEESE